jgi:hypothetical protein
MRILVVLKGKYINFGGVYVRKFNVLEEYI